MTKFLGYAGAVLSGFVLAWVLACHSAQYTADLKDANAKVADLTKQVATLQDSVKAGTATADQLKAAQNDLAAATVKLDALKAKGFLDSAGNIATNVQTDTSAAMPLAGLIPLPGIITALSLVSQLAAGVKSLAAQSQMGQGGQANA